MELGRPGQAVDIKIYAFLEVYMLASVIELLTDLVCALQCHDHKCVCGYQKGTVYVQQTPPTGTR